MSFLHRMESRFGLTRGDVTVALFLAGTALVGFIYTQFFEGRDIRNRQDAFARLIERYDSGTVAHNALLAGGLKSKLDSDSVVQNWEPLTEEEVLDEGTSQSRSEVSRSKKLTLKDVAPVNINTAPISVLQLLPGVGEKIAQKIVERRLQAPFQTTEDIMSVKGIGPKKFAQMKPYLTVGSVSLPVDSGSSSTNNAEKDDVDSGDRG